jgi:EPS-associated MarR family transcriptional regulator
MANRLTPEQREDASFRVLKLLAEHPEYSQREMAAALGISLGKLNYCLRALVEKGHVKIESFNASSHKLGYVHLLTPKGIAERAALAASFVKRKIAEYDALKAELEALESEAKSPGMDQM